jgi:hypothetical protein
MKTGKPMIDAKGRKLKIGDLVLCTEIETKWLGTVIGDTDGLNGNHFLYIRNSDNECWHKVVGNVEKISNKKAMLWMLEN